MTFRPFSINVIEAENNYVRLNFDGIRESPSGNEVGLTDNDQICITDIEQEMDIIFQLVSVRRHVEMPRSHGNSNHIVLVIPSHSVRHTYTP